jgi:hypothetical protein
MGLAASIPALVERPFDVLLLLRWQPLLKGIRLVGTSVNSSPASLLLALTILICFAYLTSIAFSYLIGERKLRRLGKKLKDPDSSCHRENALHAALKPVPRYRKGVPVLGAMLAYHMAPQEVMLDAHKTHAGEPFLLQLGLTRLVHLAKPEAVK